jgi:molybdopterin/thiamine biosynthesis adenylyltransferase
MRLASTNLPTSVKFVGKAIPGAEDRQRLIPEFDQEAYSKASVVCVGAGGIISHIAPTLCRKGIGRITLLDRDIVEPSNLNRQRFYEGDIGMNKAQALAGNLQRECIAATEICGHALQLEDAIDSGVSLACDVAICGVDNNPARLAASRFFRSGGIPVIFAAVSRDGDHGYVFVQERHGPCIGCLFPDMAADDRFPCPGTPAIADILQAVGALAIYAADTMLMERPRSWNYRRLSLSNGTGDGASAVPVRLLCRICGTSHPAMSGPGSWSRQGGR